MRTTLRAARASLRSIHRDFVFGRALARFTQDPESAIGGSRVVLDDLIYGWGNEAWSADSQYLAACVESALTTNGPVLECGSGLTTLLLGIVAQRRRFSVWALEHLPIWAERVRTNLSRHRIDSARIALAPLRRYGEFEWYAVPFEQLKQRFPLVICDGPPSATPGGRYGLLPVMKHMLEEGCLILVDDAQRNAERAMVSRWRDEESCEVSLHGDEKQYFRVRLAGGAGAGS